MEVWRRQDEEEAKRGEGSGSGATWPLMGSR
jgi:hypothetical protein